MAQAAEISTPPQTLIVLRGNRYIEVFTSDRHSAKIIAVPFMESAAGEILIEKHILQSLPPNWQDTYAECNLSDRDAIKEFTVLHLALHRFDKALHQTLNRLVGGNTESVTVTL